MDLIDRQAAIALAKDICVPTKDGSVYKHRCIDPDAIKELPSADVAEVKHGEWKQKAWIDETMEVHEDILVTKCSECGMRTYWLKGEKLWNYCPNCGADMRERRTE